jgi:hypothetical protein
MTKLAALILALLLALPALAGDRNPAKRAAFIRENPCPATLKKRGPCPGWHVDHILPLCAGGADAPENMQWIESYDHKAKTRDDVRACRIMRNQQKENRP